MIPLLPYNECWYIYIQVFFYTKITKKQTAQSLWQLNACWDRDQNDTSTMQSRRAFP